jgi:nucleoside diphosphate kinase
MARRYSEAMLILKPESMHALIPIRRMIAARFQIRFSAARRLTPKELYDLYGDLDERLWRMTAAYVANRRVQLFLLFGAHTIERAVALAGHKTRPQDCRSGSIRRRYGKAIPIGWNMTTYWRNAVHRTQSSAEARIQITALIARHRRSGLL